ncbi:type II secretion system protein GspM [Sphingorhabdus arenilitoris]|uniref:Type II secretion system protein GspM n=1 Tax=Sphingorhabdus arenilitoris TaxID=1490041 RepID=A0ABV8RHT6_9SPHN
MIETVSTWFQTLSQREKILVAVAGLLSAVVIIVLSAIGLINAITAKQEEYFAALDRRAQIERRVAEMAKAKTVQQAVGGPLQTIIAQSAAEAGFALDRADAPRPDIVDIAMAKAKPRALMTWLNGWEAQGIVVQKIDIKAANDGTISMTASLARPGS